MIQIAMTPERFAKVKEELQSLPSGVTAFAQTSETSGSFSTPQISMDYVYDGANLHLTKTAAHGMARFASEQEIQQHVLKLLAKV